VFFQRGEILSPDERQRVHLQSLRILEQVGARFHSGKARRLLAAGGAVVNEETRLVCIPPGMVEQALEITPRSIVLGARNPHYSYAMPSGLTRYGMDGTAAFALDFNSGERRYGTLRDIENGCRIFQQLELGVMAWAPTTASDAPVQSRPLHEFLTTARSCSKHVNHELHTADQAPYLAEGLAAILGSEDEFRTRKAYSVIYCPVAPLSHDSEMMDAYLDLGQYGMPVMVMPMPVPGSTGPASLFGNICLANAEALSAIVLFQLAHPGRDLLYSSGVGTLDFKTGGFLGGTPEMALQSAALTEMGRHYALPTTSAGCTSDAREPGAQAVFEKVITTIMPAMAGSEIIIGLGEIESDQLLVLEQYIVDHEIALQVQRLLEGVDTAGDKELFDDISAIGPGGHFLSRRSTRHAPRSGEFHLSHLLDHHSYEAWKELGSPSMYTNAREKVTGILATPPVDALPEAIEQELDSILRKADQELKE